MRAFITHNFSAFIHTFLTVKHAFEQGFSRLSTDIASGYYYYLYKYKTCSQANPTALSLVFGLPNSPINMKDFQLKKLRATT